MEQESVKQISCPEKDIYETPVCIRCFTPVDPLLYYCPNCGEATGQFTHYMPFVNLQWQASVWGRMWRQVWSHDVSFLGRAFRLLMIIWKVPILLIGVFFKPDKESQSS